MTRKKEPHERAEKLGRPGSYKPEYVKQAEHLCKLGATDWEISQFFGVSTTQLYRWKAQYPAFGAILKAGKEECDHRVERSLYHKAIGYTFHSEKIFNYKGEVIRAECIEHIPPDTTSMIFWLKNRRPDLWRDVYRQEHTGKDGGPISHEVRGEADALRDRVAQLAARLGTDAPARRDH